jgi:glycogen debranching enzyme
MIGLKRSETLRITKRVTLADPFMTGGDRAYLIGTQDGLFPDMGWHVPEEMGGIWAHPIKLLDGFWLQVNGRWLTDPEAFVSGPFWAIQDYVLIGNLRITRRQFAARAEPGILVRYVFQSEDGMRSRVRFLARADLQGAWPQTEEVPSGTHDIATYLPELAAWMCSHSAQPWHSIVGSPSHSPCAYESGSDLWGPERTKGDGISVALEYDLDIPAGKDVHLDFVIAGSSTGGDSAKDTYARLRDPEPHWQEQNSRYESVLRQTILNVPDDSLANAWEWVKCTFEWLVRDVPGTGRGLGGGAADYVWWFGCDSFYALLGCLAMGRHDIAVETMDLLRTLSIEANGGSGRVIHEANTRGDVVNAGRTQETPHFVSTVYEIFRWTGDEAFLRRNYEFCCRALLGWTLDQCRDGDLFPLGEGIVEYGFMDLRCVDTAAQTVAALDALAAMAEVLDDLQVSERCRRLSEQARADLDRDFWLEDEGLYGDMLATPTEMIPRLRRWIENVETHPNTRANMDRILRELGEMLHSAETDPQLNRRRAWNCRNWIVIAPLEARLAPVEKAQRVLQRVEGPEFSGPWGMYLSGIHRTQAMSIGTGVLATAEIAYGRVEQGLAYIHQLTDTLEMRTPGAISEISPNDGCFVQAWSGFAIAWPIVAHVFGVQPEAHRKHIDLRPVFPDSWHRASLRNLLIGNAAVDFYWDGQELLVVVPDAGWSVSSESVPVRVETTAERTSVIKEGPASAVRPIV